MIQIKSNMGEIFCPLIVLCVTLRRPDAGDRGMRQEGSPIWRIYMAGIKKNIIVKTFPHLVISDGERAVTEDAIRSDMVVRLFSYLICNHKKVCTTEELANALWQGDESVNPAGALKNLAYRLRQIMKKHFPGIEFIKTGRGGYSWNQELPLSLDADVFSAEIKKAEKAQEREEKIRHYGAAFSLYQGRFLASIAEDAWVVPKMAAYENAFLQTAENYTRLLEEAGEYTLMEEAARAAIEIDSLTEEQIKYLDSWEV